MKTRNEHELYVVSNILKMKQRIGCKGNHMNAPLNFEELTVDEIYNMCLYSCDGFVMLIVYHGGRSDPYFWLLDLFTSDWSNLSKNSNSERKF